MYCSEISSCLTVGFFIYCALLKVSIVIFTNINSACFPAFNSSIYRITKSFIEIFNELSLQLCIQDKSIKLVN